MKKFLLNKYPVFNLNSPNELCAVLDMPVEAFKHTVRYAETLYEPINLPKKKPGEYRIIHAPSSELKIIQRKILDSLLIKTPLSKSAYGFGPQRSIIQNAERHKEGNFMLNVDIKNFFPSVHYSKINQIYLELGLHNDLAQRLTKLTTLNKGLPQGAPTSPYLAALALSVLDVRMQNLCKSNRLVYTRYFDDISISGDKRAHEVLDSVKDIVLSEGYQIHTEGEKIGMYKPGEIKKITGILIMPDGQLKVEDLDSIESYIKSFANKENFGKIENLQKEKEVLYGKVAFIQQLDITLGKKLKKILESIDW